ncbi:DUF2304 domain-containing protein [Arthrobacter sp. Edens01]|uniref:DUF2304 domain-containing protein n=1 Tax=Arthrobacter sp. Edens01 TaxID=1732020 RepID=UPI0006DB57AD|nr:DUF2304 domain-containing protein [Arthrobacter sp. Edens01]KPN22153.1 hypothetical protein AO716_03965 [Arthrobacter sp. Edens01]
MTNTLVPFIMALLVVGAVVWLLRQRKLREKYAVLWILVGLATLVLAGFPQLLTMAADLAGFALPSNLLFLLAILLPIGVCLHLSLEISVVEDETRALAEEAAILRAQLDAVQARVDRMDPVQKLRHSGDKDEMHGNSIPEHHSEEQ